MTLVHNRSYFTDKQMVKLQESPGTYVHNLVAHINAYVHGIFLCHLKLCAKNVNDHVCVFKQQACIHFIYHILH